QLLRLASTLPSMISLSHEVISPERVISRPTVSLRTSPSPRRGGALRSGGRRIGSGGRIAVPARARSGARGGSVRGLAGAVGARAGPGADRALRLHRDAQIVRRICHFAVLCLGSLPAKHGWDTRSILLKGWRYRRPGQGCGSRRGNSSKMCNIKAVAITGAT